MMRYATAKMLGVDSFTEKTKNLQWLLTLKRRPSTITKQTEVWTANGGRLLAIKIKGRQKFLGLAPHSFYSWQRAHQGQDTLKDRELFLVVATRALVTRKHKPQISWKGYLSFKRHPCRKPSWTQLVHFPKGGNLALVCPGTATSICCVPTFAYL